MQDDFSQDVYIFLFLGQRNELVGEYDARFVKLQAHECFCGVEITGLHILDRLAVDQNPRIIRIMLFIDVGKLVQDILIAMEGMDVFRDDPVNRALGHRPVNARNIVYGFARQADFIDGFPDHDFVIIAKLLIKREKGIKHFLDSLFIIRVLFLGEDEHHMAPADRKQPHLSEEPESKLPYEPFHFVGDLLPLLIQLPHVQAHEHKVLFLLAAILHHILQRPDIVGTQLSVIRVGMQDVHHGDHRQLQARDRKRALAHHSLQQEQQEGNAHGPVKADHDRAEQDIAHPCHKKKAQYEKADIGIEEDAPPHKADPRFDEIKGGSLCRGDDICQQYGRKKDIGKQKIDP